MSKKLRFFLVLIASVTALAKSAPPPHVPDGLRRVTADIVGGSGGELFGDYTDNITGVDSISISYDDNIESIQLTYRMLDGSLYKAPRHGGFFHPQFTITLAADEFIERVEGTTNGVLIDQMSITTFQPKELVRRTYGPFGKQAKQAFLFEGHHLALYGRCGLHLDALGSIAVYPLQKSDQFGGNDGDDFEESPDTFFTSPVMKITKVLVNYGDAINAIQVEYYLRDGRVKRGDVHGEPTGKWTAVKIDDKEVLMGIKGKTNSHVSQLTFLVLTPDGKFKKFGPFGKSGPGMQPFSVYGFRSIIGFAGNEGKYLNAIAAYQ